MGPGGALGHRLGQGAEGQGLLVRAGPCPGNCVDGKGTKGEASVSDGGAGRQLLQGRQTRTSAGDGRAGRRHRLNQKKEPGPQGGKKEKDEGGPGGVTDLQKRVERWRSKGFWSRRIQRWRLWRGMLRLEQWEWVVRRPPTWRPLQSQSSTPPPLHSLWIPWASLKVLPFQEGLMGFLIMGGAVLCGNGEGSQPSRREP